MPRDWLTIDQAAVLLHLTYNQVYDLITVSKRLHATKPAGQWRIPDASLLAHAHASKYTPEQLQALHAAIVRMHKTFEAD